MKLTVVALLIVVGLTLNYGMAFATEDCVFDAEYFSKKTYALDQKIISFVWQEKEQVARLLTKEGSLITVRHWDCRHIGIQANMLLDSVEMNKEILVKKRIFELINIVVREKDKKTAKRKIQRMDCLHKSECRKNLAMQGYSEFFVETERQRNNMTIFLKYYFN